MLIPRVPMSETLLSQAVRLKRECLMTPECLSPDGTLPEPLVGLSALQLIVPAFL